MNEKDINIEVINRYFKGNYSENDEKYIEEIFRDKTIEDKLSCHLSQQFNEICKEEVADDKNLDHILYRIHYNINTRMAQKGRWSVENMIKWTLRIAGLIILPFLFYTLIQTNRDLRFRKEGWVEIKAPAWTRIQFNLPDGTTGWLNSNSSLRYSGNYYTRRQVDLTGEAFFDVLNNRRKPFIVNTPDITVTATGTKFNVASYENEKTVEVVLVEGKVLFEGKGSDKAYALTTNDLVTYDKTVQDFSVEVVQPQKYVSWTEGKLVFRNDPLDVIARRLERWYNVVVEVNVNMAEEYRWRATFDDESLEVVLHLLKRSMDLNYRIEQGGLQQDTTYKKKKIIITQ